MMVVDACRDVGTLAVAAPTVGVCGQAGFWLEWFNIDCKPGEGLNTKCTGERDWISCMKGVDLNRGRMIGSLIGSTAC